MPKVQEDALRSQPLVPGRVKVRVTEDGAQVMTVSMSLTKKAIK